MARIDLSGYLARRTSEHIFNKVGNVTFRDGIFECKGNKLEIWSGYDMSFIDDGDEIRIEIDNKNSKALRDLKTKINGAAVPRKYRSVIEDMGFVSGEKLDVVLSMVPRQNTEGRVADRNRVFHAVYNTAIRPILDSAYGMR
tara:strand:- start:311 stop:736 length:426 start_codon:yes stop_codon:yes gene_type:complete